MPGPVTVTAFENTRACELFATVMTFGLSFHEPVMLLSPFAPALPDDATTIDAGVDRRVERLRGSGRARRVGRQPAAVAEADVERVGLVGDDVLDRGDELRRVAVEAVAHEVRAGRHPRERQRERRRAGRVVVGAVVAGHDPGDVGPVQRAAGPRHGGVASCRPGRRRRCRRSPCCSRRSRAAGPCGRPRRRAAPSGSPPAR